MRRTTTKYNLDEKVQFNSTVISTVWNDSTSKWQIKIRSSDGGVRDDTADILINGSGILNSWNWPGIPGLHSFQGTLVHSAAWDPAIDWTGKRVALIGNGSSGIQIMPKVQQAAKHVVTYIRNPTWIAPSMVSEDGKPPMYTNEYQQHLRENPQELRDLRRGIESHVNRFFLMLLKGTPEQVAVQEETTAVMKQRLGDNPDLHDKLIPKWQLGCRRLTLGEGYLEALQKPNVTVEMSPIQQVTNRGIVTTNSVEEFDIIICATGFDVSFAPLWELVGKDGIRLADQWRDSPEAYFGVCAPNMPNYFIFNGPNCPAGHGNLLSAMDWMADYILRWCRKIAEEDIKYVRFISYTGNQQADYGYSYRTVQVRQDATDDYNTYSQEFMKRTAWSSGCRSWYKRGTVDGRVTAMYAGSLNHYRQMLGNFRTEDFIIDYRSPNRFRFMGNGLTIAEEKREDFADYMN